MTTSAPGTTSAEMPPVGDPPLPRRAHRLHPGHAVLLWSGAVLVGLVILVLMLPVLYGWQDLAVMPEAEGIAVTGYLTWQLLVGAVGLGALAWSLWRGPGWTDHLVVFCGMASLLVTVPGLVMFGAVVSRLERRPTLTASGLALAGAAVDVRMDPTADDPWRLWVGTLPLFLVIALVAVWAGRRRERREQAQDRQVERLHSAELRARTARSEERTRIARDLHDTLSHRLSLIALHAGALSYRDDLTREQIREATAVLRNQAEEATDDLREVLTVLRNDQTTIDPATGVRELIASARRAGTSVIIDDASLDLADAAARLPTLTAHAVHRVIQETLTNARKHAPGQQVTIHLELAGDTLVVEVSNPAPPQRCGTEPGTGLLGLRERAELCGGSLRVTERETFTVRLEVPWEER